MKLKKYFFKKVFSTNDTALRLIRNGYNDKAKLATKFKNQKIEDILLDAIPAIKAAGFNYYYKNEFISFS